MPAPSTRRAVPVSERALPIPARGSEADLDRAILDAAVEHKAQAVGMSGLLVKSTVVMRENLEE
jgi:cobalamin-dependent methionine synthase I